MSDTRKGLLGAAIGGLGALTFALASPGCFLGQVGSLCNCPAECESDSGCRLALEQEAMSLSIGRDAGVVRLESKGCTEDLSDGASDGRPVCLCRDIERDTIFSVGAETSLCALWDRFGSACLYPTSEFPGCEPGDAESCRRVCADLANRGQEEAAISYDYAIRHATCNSSSHCDSVVRFGDACFTRVGISASLQKYDCSLSDAQILETDKSSNQ